MGGGRIDGGISAYNAPTDSPYYPVATVKPGETSLAQVEDRLRAQGTPVDFAELQKLNPHISDSTQLTPGQWIRVPMSAGENLPMVEGESTPSGEPVSPSGLPTGPKDDPISKNMVQWRLEAQTNGTKQTQASKLTGMSLGTNNQGQEVKIKREVGDPQGYDDELKATAVARLAHTEPAAVVKIDGKYHAVETTADNLHYDGEDFTRDAQVGKAWVHGLAPYSEIEGARKEVVALKQKIDQYDQVSKQNSGRLPKALDQQRDEDIRQLGVARTKLASLEFGVEPAQIQFNRSEVNKSPNRINITPNLGEGGNEGPIFGQGDHFRDSKMAIQIDLKQIENPDRVEGVLFHEVSHLKDSELAQSWVKKYETETNRTFVDGPPGRNAFETWMKAQTATHPPRISKGDAELVVDMSQRDGRTTEARAFVHSALAAVQAGAPEVATKELAGYASHMQTENHRSGDNRYQNPVDNSAVKDDLKREILAAYQHMSKPQQQQLKDAIAEAKKANPEAWISQVKLP